MLIDTLVVLKQLKERGKPREVDHAQFGICFQITHTNNYVYTKRLMRQWPKYSGDSDYPIPDPDGIEDPSVYYSRSGSSAMWNKEHPYGALRHELLDYLIEKLESQT